MKLIDADRLPTLTTKRLSVRWLEQSDAPSLYEIYSNSKAMRYWSTTPWTDPSEGAECIASIHHCFAAQSLFEWGVVRIEDDALIGTCTLAQIDADHRRAEIGFMLRPDCWGRGYMTEAVHALLEFSFRTLNLHRIEADVDPRNTSSIRLLERFGFQREGYVRERWFVGEEINDGILYGLLHREYSYPSSVDT